MLTKKIEKILNDQVEKEAYSSALYLAMASWAEVSGFQGIAQWLYIQSDEERLHMLKFVKYINERGGKAVIPELKKPPLTYKNVKLLFQDVLKHEEFITASINEIVHLCGTEKDYTTHSWVQWFVNEQIEEEANVRTILDKLNLLGEHNLYLFDRDIVGLRTASAGQEAQ
jgi:ferritin